jgi:plastocyanin
MTDIDESTSPEETAPSAEVAVPPAVAPEPVSFWNRPYVEKFFTPLVLPLLVVAGIVVYVLNVSRLFLSAHGHIPVIIGTVITLVILVGAASLSASPRLRQSQVVLLTTGFVAVLAFSGWISLGRSQVKGEASAPLPADLNVKQIIKVTAAPGGQLAFAPNSLPVKTGLVKFEVNFAAAGHTFQVQDPKARFAELKPPGTGVVSGVAFFSAAGDVTFLCTIPGHEAAGMKGTITITGPAMTLEQALAADGLPPTAAAGEGGGGGEAGGGH